MDAETGELHPSLSDGQRAYDLSIAEENFAGELLDVMAMLAEQGEHRPEHRRPARGRRLAAPALREPMERADDPALADRLETAYGRETKVLALTIPEREKILAALDDPPADLAELRGVLLRELAWLRSEGLT